MKIIHNRLLGGWFIVRGPHQTPISGRFDTREQALAAHAAAQVNRALHLRRRSRPAESDESPRPVRGIRMSGSPFALGY
jgi:hypothetical protein